MTIKDRLEIEIDVLAVRRLCMARGKKVSYVSASAFEAFIIILYWYGSSRPELCGNEAARFSAGAEWFCFGKKNRLCK